MVRNDRRYLETHEWVKQENGTATVGISDYAQETLGDITYVELPKVGAKLTKGQTCCVIESVKAASDIYAPVSGTVDAVNTKLTGNPEIINSSPYDEGWVFRIKDFSGAEYGACMDSAAYSSFLESVQ